MLCFSRQAIHIYAVWSKRRFWRISTLAELKIQFIGGPIRDPDRCNGTNLQVVQLSTLHCALHSKNQIQLLLCSIQSHSVKLPIQNCSVRLIYLWIQLCLNLYIHFSDIALYGIECTSRVHLCKCFGLEMRLNLTNKGSKRLQQETASHSIPKSLLHKVWINPFLGVLASLEEPPVIHSLTGWLIHGFSKHIICLFGLTSIKHLKGFSKLS